MITRFIDVHEPILNVFEDDTELGFEPGSLMDFGLSPTNSMAGQWRVLSVERIMEVGGRSHLRVNVEKVRDRP